MAGANPLVVAPTDTSSALSGTLLLESVTDLVSAIDSGGWLDTALAGFGVAMDTAAAVMDPIGQLLAAGLGWLMEHLEPLKGWLNDLTGDAGAVAAFAATWDNIATQLLTAAENHTRLVATDLAAMSGDAIDAYTRHATELTDTLRSISGAAGAVSGSLQTASTIVQVVHDIVRDALAEIVGAAISWAFQLTITVGLGTPWVVAQVSTRVSSLASRVGTKVTALLESLRKLGDLITPLRRAFETITDALRRTTAGGLRRIADAIDPPVRGDGARGRSRVRGEGNDEGAGTTVGEAARGDGSATGGDGSATEGGGSAAGGNAGHVPRSSDGSTAGSEDTTPGDTAHAAVTRPLDEPDPKDGGQPSDRRTVEEPEAADGGVPEPAGSPTEPWHGDDGLSLTADEAAAVRAEAARVAETEPQLTEAMQETVEQIPGARLEGLEHRLKTEESLLRKVATDLVDDPDLSVDSVLDDIRDAVRYTVTAPDQGYRGAVESSVRELTEAGYENVSWKNTWDSPGYVGINSAWRDPSTGTVFEVQFHTPASFEAKMSTHELYEQLRLPDLDVDEQVRLVQAQAEVFAGVPRAPGATDLTIEEVLP